MSNGSKSVKDKVVYCPAVWSTVIETTCEHREEDLVDQVVGAGLAGLDRPQVMRRTLVSGS